MGTLDKLFSADVLGGDTGGATLDLLKQIQQASQAGFTAGVSKKEAQLDNLLKASQDVFKIRYEKEEPFIQTAEGKRPLNNKELLGAALGIPPEGVVWEPRPPETGQYAPPLSYREWQLMGGEEGTGMPYSQYTMNVYRGRGLAQKRFETQVKQKNDKIWQDAYEQAYKEIVMEPRFYSDYAAGDPELDTKILNRTQAIYGQLQKPAGGKRPLKEKGILD